MTGFRKAPSGVTESSFVNAGSPTGSGLDSIDDNPTKSVLRAEATETIAVETLRIILADWLRLRNSRSTSKSQWAYCGSRPPDC